MTCAAASPHDSTITRLVSRVKRIPSIWRTSPLLFQASEILGFGFGVSRSALPFSLPCGSVASSLDLLLCAYLLPSFVDIRPID